MFRDTKETTSELRRTSRDESYYQNRHHSCRSVRNVDGLLCHLRHRRLVYFVPRSTQTLRDLLLARLRQLGRQSDPLRCVQGGLSRGISSAALSGSMLSVADRRRHGRATAAETTVLGPRTAIVASCRRHLAAGLLNFELFLGYPQDSVISFFGCHT